MTHSAGRMTTIVAALLAVALVAGCGSSSKKSSATGGGGASGGGKIALVAYSTPKEAYADLIPGFQKTPAGKGATFGTAWRC